MEVASVLTEQFGQLVDQKLDGVEKRLDQKLDGVISGRQSPARLEPITSALTDITGNLDPLGAMAEK